MSCRSAGWAGIACVVVVAIALFLPGPSLPSAVDSGKAVAAFISSHRWAWMLGAWLTFPEMAFFLWFVAGIKSAVERGPENGALTVYMLCGATATVAAGLIATTLQIVLGIVPSEQMGFSAARILYVAWLVSGVPVLFMPLVLTQGAAARALRNSPSAPSWLAPLGYGGAALSAVATLSTFFVSGPLALNGPIGYLAFFVFALWVVLTSRWLITL